MGIITTGNGFEGGQGTMIRSIGVISDIHSNPGALEGALTILHDVDRIFCLGDIIGIGPWPSETVDMLINDRRIVSVYGNHEYNTIHGTEMGPLKNFPRKPHHRWVKDELTDDQMNFIKGLPAVVMETHGGINFTLMHCHPDDCGAMVPFYTDQSPSILDDYYHGVEGDVLLFGHTHKPLDVHGMKRYLNPGSVGAQNRGTARFMRIDLEDGNISVSQLQAPYDRLHVIEGLMKRKVPNGDFIKHVFYSD